MDTLEKIRTLARAGRIVVSVHGYDELAADDIFVDDALRGLNGAELVEDYPQAAKGPSVLVLQHDADNKPIHAVWGIPSGAEAPAVLVTAYRPDPARWLPGFKERRRS
ncbi:MAG: DUF4258 domain-containing protein [Rhizomicrobium sp.]